MPKYVFKCGSCGSSQELFTSSKQTETACTCGQKQQRQFPNIVQQRVTEVVDQYTGTTRDQNHAENMKDRRDEHYWNVEVPRLIQTMSVETCLEQGWLVYNEKGELVINKPPSKR